MADCKSETSRKRRREDDINPEAKRQKSAPAEETSPGKKLTDLKDNCLWKIFGLLEIGDLLNVANVNKTFSAAANSVFSAKHGHKRIIIDGVCVDSFSPICYESQDQILIRDLKAVYGFLRCFGRYITKLEVCYLEISKPNCARLNQYIEKYCTTSLTEIKLFNAPEFLKHTMTSFPEMQSVSVFRSNLGSQLSKFGQWFPNLRRLDLSWNKNYVDTFFPHLKHLSVMINHDGPAADLTLKSVAALMRSNHLQCLEISISPIPVTFNDFLQIIGIQPLVTKLVVLHGITSFIQNDRTLARFVNAMPSLVELDLSHFTLTPDVAIAYIRQFKFLKRFVFRLTGPSRVDCLRQHLAEGWRISVDFDVVDLER